MNDNIQKGTNSMQQKKGYYLDCCHQFASNEAWPINEFPIAGGWQGTPPNRVRSVPMVGARKKKNLGKKGKSTNFA